MLGSRRLRLALAAAAALTGCNALLDVKDIYLDPTDDGGGALDPDAAKDSSTSAEGSAGDGGAEGGACNADLQIDKDNCGRCGHGCAGGTCTAGKCDAVTLAAALANPSGLTLGADDVYFTTYGASGTVQSIKKAGGLLTVLAPSEYQARGVALSGNTLYWGNGDFTFDDAGAKGGIWQCTLPGCTGKKILAPGGYYTAFPVVRGPFLYFGAGEKFTVERVPLTGGAAGLVADVNRPFGIAVDDSHVYYTSNETSISRAPIAGDGGGIETVGTLNGDRRGFVTLDDQRVYWAFTDSDGKGQVLSLPKANLGGGATAYGTEADNVNPLGIAVDADNVYWSTAGTGTADAPVGDGKILSCKKQGCGGNPPVVLATGCNLGFQIALDDVAVYWTEFGTYNTADGRLRKVAKP